MFNEELVELVQKSILDTGYIDDAYHMQQLYINNLPVIRKIASKYTNYVELEDLLQEGYFGLYEAAKHYKTDSEVKFITYAVYWIKQAMQRYIENCGRIIRIPTHLMECIVKYNRIIGQYEKQYNRLPMDTELVSEIGCSRKKLEQIKMVCRKMEVSSIDEQVNEDSQITLCETISSGENIENEYIDIEMKNKLKNQLWDIIGHNLTEQEHDIIIERYRNNKTRQEIADIMDDGVSFVRNMEDRAMRKLRVPRIKKILEEQFDIAMSKAYKGSIVSGNILYSSTERAAFKDMCIRI